MSANTTKTRVTPQPKTARDTIYAAIAAHRLAWAEHLNACDLISRETKMPKIDPTTATNERHRKATAALAKTVPTTLHGLTDVLAYVANHDYVEEFFADESETAAFLKSLATAAHDFSREDCIQSAEQRVAERAHA